MIRILTLVFFLLYPVRPAFAGLDAEDFAYGFLLDTKGDGAIYSLVMPDEVYRVARRADLGDVRVLNADDEVVPHVLRQLAEDETDLRSRETVPFFPITEEAKGDGQGNLAVDVSRSADGMIISVAADSVAAADGSGEKSYLLDLSGVELETGRLEIAWQDSDISFATVSLAESDDLQHWRPLVDSAVLVDLEFGGHRVASKDIVLPVGSLRYLMMTGKEGERLPELLTVTAISERPAERKLRRWLPLGEGQVGHEGARIVIDYTSDNRLPADAVRLRFSEANSMIRASVLSRQDAESRWISRCSAVFYSLARGGATISDEVCSFGKTSNSLWRLEIIEDGLGLEQSGRAPTLELGWTAAELLFVARGPAPFTLAFGSGRLEEDAGQPAKGMILQAVSGKEAEQLVKPASLGGRVELGGKAALNRPPPPLPWKKWLLWSVLCLGVGLLTLMVRHLLREMRRES
jgi:hypothetical protein